MRTNRIQQIHDILQRIQFQDWQFLTGRMGDGHYIQVAFIAQDHDDPAVTATQKGRKLYVSRHAIPQEIVFTAFLAVKLATEHEMREQFLYQGKAILGPHIAVESLFKAAHDTVHRA